MADIRTELGLSGSISLNTTTVRTLLGKSSGIIKISDAYGKTKPNTIGAQTSSVTSTSFYLYLSITNAAPNSPVIIDVTYSSAGQPLGQVLTGTTNSSGNWSWSGTNSSPNAYWYPRSKTCTYAFKVNGATLGSLSVSS